MRAIMAGFWSAGLLMSMASYADTIEVDVNGLTCAFCVDSLQRQLQKMPAIEQVDVSLKSKKVRIVSRADSIDIEQVRAKNSSNVNGNSSNVWTFPTGKESSNPIFEPEAQI